MTVQLQANKPIAIVTATELFDVAMPQTLAAYRARGHRLSGSFEIGVYGAGGGTWFIDAAHAICRRYEGEDTDCVLEMGTDELAAIVRGRLDVDAALQSGRLRFSGDPDKLITLGHLLAG